MFCRMLACARRAAPGKRKLSYRVQPPSPSGRTWGRITSTLPFELVGVLAGDEQRVAAGLLPEGSGRARQRSGVASVGTRRGRCLKGTHKPEGHGNRRSPRDQRVRRIAPPFRRRPVACSSLSSTYCYAGWSRSPATLPRIGTTTSRSWSFVISSPCSSAMLAARARRDRRSRRMSRLPIAFRLLHKEPLATTSFESGVSGCWNADGTGDSVDRAV
jgi:hypothetical protein